MLTRLFHTFKSRYLGKKPFLSAVDSPIKTKKESIGFLYIFLDIDGVLNNLMDSQFDITSRVISDENLKAYKYLLNKLDTQNISYSIILSSTWRHSDEARYFLVKKGVLYHRSMSDLVTNSSKARQEEIKEFISKLEGDPNCLILDDFVYQEDFKENDKVVVNTCDPKKGLTEREVDMLIHYRLVHLWKT